MLSVLLLAVVGTLIYSNTFDASFHFDDTTSIVENSAIHNFDLKAFMHGGRPVLDFTFALNYYFGRIEVFGYHLVNLLLHISNAVMLFFILLWTINNAPHPNPLPQGGRAGEEASQEPGRRELSVGSFSRVPLYASLVFIAHPVQTQAVTYIVSRSSVLAAFFCLLSLLLFIKAYKQRAERGKNYSLLFFAGALSAFILALGSKQEAATFPLVLLLYDYYFLSDKKWRLLRDRAGFHLATFGVLLFGVYYVFSSQLQMFLTFDSADAISGYGNEKLTSFTYFLTQLHVIPHYIKLLFLPLNLNMDYDWPITRQVDFDTAFYFLMLLSIIILAVWLSSRERLLSFGILWFFLTLMVTSSFIVIYDVIFEHRLYLPSIGFAIVMAVLISRISTLKLTAKMLIKQTKQYFEFIMITVLVLLYGFGAYHRNFVWKDDLSLWTDTVRKSPDKARPHYNLGVIYQDSGQTDRAIESYQRAISINPVHAKVYNNLGKAYLSKGFVEKAIRYFKLELQVNPDNALAHFNLGVVYLEHDMPDEAGREFRTALSLNPKLIQAREFLDYLSRANK